MAKFLHLLRTDSAAVAAPVIEGHRQAPGSEVTVVLLDSATLSRLPPGVALRRLGADLDYAALLDLIFQSDHVISW